MRLMPPPRAACLGTLARRGGGPVPLIKVSAYPQEASSGPAGEVSKPREISPASRLSSRALTPVAALTPAAVRAPEGPRGASSWDPLASPSPAGRASAAPASIGEFERFEAPFRDAMAACGARLTLRDRSACKTVPECVDLDGVGSDAVVVGRSRKDADVCLDLPPPAPACLVSRRRARRGNQPGRLSTFGSQPGQGESRRRRGYSLDRPCVNAAATAWIVRA